VYLVPLSFLIDPEWVATTTDLFLGFKKKERKKRAHLHSRFVLVIQRKLATSYC